MNLMRRGQELQHSFMISRIKLMTQTLIFLCQIQSRQVMSHTQSKGEMMKGTLKGPEDTKISMHFAHILCQDGQEFSYHQCHQNSHLAINKDSFVESRMYFLDRFMKKIGEIGYLVNSTEFRCFSRPSGDVSKTLASLPPVTPQTILERLENDLSISTYIADDVYKK